MQFTVSTRVMRAFKMGTETGKVRPVFNLTAQLPAIVKGQRVVGSPRHIEMALAEGPVTCWPFNGRRPAPRQNVLPREGADHMSALVGKAVRTA